jgi:hypothetical protein
MTAPRLDLLGDQQAISVLQLVLERDRRLPDPDQLEELDTRVREAAAQPVDPSDTTDTAGGDVIQAGAEDLAGGLVTPGGLARETLTYLLAERPDLAEVIDRAVAMSHQDPLEVQSRFEPVTVGVGALVVLALQTDLQIERGSNGKWRFKLHKKAMSDSTLGKLLAKVVAAYGGGPGA